MEKEHKTTMRYCTHRMTKVKNKKRVTSVGEDVEKLGHLCNASGIIKWCGRFGKQSSISSKY